MKFVYTSTAVYDGACHTPGAVFQARLLDNQEGANTERNVLGKLSERCSQRRPSWHLWHYTPAVEISSMENRLTGV